MPIDARHYAYLVPYGKKAQFQPSYKGYVHIAKRDPDVDNIQSVIVYTDDVFSFDIGDNKIKHVPDLDSDNYANDESIKFIYAKVRFKSGSGRASMFEVMTKKQVDKIKDSAKQKFIWNTHYGEMARKTVIKRLCKHAQLGDIAVFDEVDNANEQNKIINVTPEGELLVDDADHKFKTEYITKLEACKSFDEFEALQLANQDKMQELMLWNVQASKDISKVERPISERLYIDKLEDSFDGCEDAETLDVVYANHERRIESMRIADKKHIQAYFASCKGLLTGVSKV